MSKWTIKNDQLNQTDLVNEIYSSRGITNYEEQFQLTEEAYDDPYLFQPMKKTVDRISLAIQKNEKILIYGDYDVDGITSTYLLYDTIKNMGGNISFDIPNRFVDGYGLTANKAYEIINDEFTLVITVDNGIKSVEEATIFKENNVDFIITDHHKSQHQPDAFSIIHTEYSDYPFKPLAGVGVAFKVAQALIGEEAYIYNEVAALGTVADMMPLVDENRAIVNVGLKQMRFPTNLGLRELLRFLEIDFPSVSDIQYKIAPRINSCGRMKSAKLAVKLLLSKTKREALRTIREIEELNNKRKKLTKVLYNDTIKHLDTSKPSIITASKRMHEGVLGIVASRLANEYLKTAVVLKEDEFTYKGSIRSYNGVNTILILRQLKDILMRFGGHKNAAGLEFKKDYFKEFKQRFNDLIPQTDDIAVQEAEGKIDIYTLDIKQIEALSKYDLKDCLFVFENIFVKKTFLIQNEHTKLNLDYQNEAIFFNNTTLYNKLKDVNYVSLLGRLDTNTFRNKTKKQIIIEDYLIK
ncbi:MAG: single-stranded-DNA-specific exonuclease RecJ [Candidatus Izimaplasma sp.]|nr:single-stranded-DNA-specific exonuclease RecJ [Candidatus Izimaplasma bacterium]